MAVSAALTSAADRSMPTPTPPPPFPPHAAAGAGGDVLAASGAASVLGGTQSRLAMAVGPGSCGQSTAARIFHRTELAALEEGGSEATGCGPVGLKDFVGDASAGGGGGGHTSLPQIDASTISVLTHLRNKLARASESRCTTASGGGAARRPSVGALVVLPPQPVAVAAASATVAATAAAKKEGTSRLVVELKALQLQVDRLRDGRSGVDGAGGGLGGTLPGGGLGGTQQQLMLSGPQGSKGTPSSPSQRTITRKLIPAQESSAAADGGDGANSTNPLTAAKEIRRKIQRIRCDPHLREELSMQCEAYQRERQAKRSCASPSAAADAATATAAAAAGSSSGGAVEAADADCVRRNASPRSLAACSEEARARSLRRRRREREARTADTRRARVQALSAEHARREHQLGKKMLHLAMLKGTLSTKQSQVVTASRMWMPIYFAYVFARRVQDQLEHARMVEAVCVRGKQVGAVRSLERWWQRHSARRELNAYKVALKLARPWRHRAQVRIVKRHYLLIAQFTKDWCASKRVVVAVKRVMTRTKKIQQWFLRIILVRRARKALWLAQWSCCEERARAAHDNLSARALKKHGNLLRSSRPPPLPHQPRQPASPLTPKPLTPKVASDDGTAAGVETVHARRASRAARRSVADHRAGRSPLDSSCEVDVGMFKKLTALPCVPEAYRMEAVSAEMLLVTRRHTKRVIAAEKEWAEYHVWEEGAREQRRQMLAAGLSEAPEDDDDAHPVPAPIPRLGALLPQTDLHRLIEATTKRFAAAIADRVASDIGAVLPEQQETLKQAALGHCVFTPAPPSPPSLVGQLQQPPPPRRHGRTSHFPVSPQRKPTPTPADSEAATF